MFSSRVHCTSDGPTVQGPEQTCGPPRHYFDESLYTGAQGWWWWCGTHSSGDGTQGVNAQTIGRRSGPRSFQGTNKIWQLQAISLQSGPSLRGRGGGVVEARVNHNGAHTTCEAHATRDHQRMHHAHARPTEWWSAGGEGAWRSGARGPHTHGNTVRQVVDDRRAAEVRGQQNPSNDPCNNQHNLSTPTFGHR